MFLCAQAPLTDEGHLWARACKGFPAVKGCGADWVADISCKVFADFPVSTVLHKGCFRSGSQHITMCSTKQSFPVREKRLRAARCAATSTLGSQQKLLRCSVLVDLALAQGAFSPMPK